MVGVFFLPRKGREMNRSEGALTFMVDVGGMFLRKRRCWLNAGKGLPCSSPSKAKLGSGRLYNECLQGLEVVVRSKAEVDVGGIEMLKAMSTICPKHQR
jgi:hypothetical protein